MESTKENIECEKDGVTKFFSAKQLGHIGKGPDGSYDGWRPTAQKPAGIPDKVVIGGSDNKPGGYDPNGGTTVNVVQSGSGDAASTTTDLNDPNAVKGDAGDGNTNSGDTANSGDSTQQKDSGDADSGDKSQTGDAGSGDDASTANDGDGTTTTNEGKPSDAEKVEKTTRNKPGPKPKTADSPKE